jgi:hypothetical protein
VDRAAAALESLVTLDRSARGDEQAMLEAVRAALGRLAAALELTCVLVARDERPDRVLVLAARCGADAADSPARMSDSPRRHEDEALPDVAAVVHRVAQAAGIDPDAACWYGALLDPMRGRAATEPERRAPLLVVIGSRDEPDPAARADQINRAAVTLWLALDRLDSPLVAAAAGPDRETVNRLADDNVQFTVYRPRALPAGSWTTVLAFAHLAEALEPGDRDPVAAVEEQARRVLDNPAGYRDTTSDATAAVPRGGALTFQLALDGCDVNPPEHQFRWLKDVHRVEFDVHAPLALQGRPVRGALTVYLGPVVIGLVALQVPVVGADAAAATPETDPVSGGVARNVFPSYARGDQAIVEETMAWVEPLGFEYWQDLRKLRSGDRWSERLLELITKADRFQLFWSDAAERSGEVAREYRHALALGRPGFVFGTYWQSPPPPFPAELAALHFACLPGRAAEIARALAAPAAPAQPQISPPPDSLPRSTSPLGPAAPAPARPASAAPPAAPTPERRRARPRRLPVAVAAGVSAMLAAVVVGVGAMLGGGSGGTSAAPDTRASGFAPTGPAATGPVLSGAVISGLAPVPATGDTIADVLPAIGLTCVPLESPTVVSGRFRCPGDITVTLARFLTSTIAASVFTDNTAGIGEHSTWSDEGGSGTAVAYTLPPGAVGLSWTYATPEAARSIVGDAIAPAGTDLDAWWTSVRTPVAIGGS